VCQFTFAQQETPDNSEVHRSLQDCGSSVEIGSCHTFGVYSLEVGPRFLENLLTHDLDDFLSNRKPYINETRNLCI
jgi:hypothetical protein